MVQHLVQGTTFASRLMPAATLVHTQSLTTTATQYQVEYITGTQSWLGLPTSHLMRWRCFLSAESHGMETRQLLNLTDCSYIIHLFGAGVVD